MARGRSRRAGFLIALVRPDHYVLVEDAAPGWVTVGDPEGKALTGLAIRRYTPAKWKAGWTGVALYLETEPRDKRWSDGVME